MGGFSKNWRSSSGSRRGAGLKCLGILVAFWSALAPPFARADDAPGARRTIVPSKDCDAPPAARPIAVSDVVLHRGGVLDGVVFWGTSDSKIDEPVAGVAVALLHGGKVVAETRSDQRGRFAISHLRGGTYAIAIARPGGVEWSVHRFWTPAAAPPKASAVAKVVLGSGVVRGQGALPAVSFTEAALIAGVVVGAVAVPVIYHNAQKSNRVPASP